MFRFIPVLLITLLMASCSGDTSNAEATVEPSPTEFSVTTAPAPPTESAQNGTLLCEVNGTPWHYSEASGIITTDRKTEARTAIITFKKKLDKGSESIQLYYDADTRELQKASLQFKFPHTDGSLLTCFYDLNASNKYNWLPGSSLGGRIDLTNTETASGTGEIIEVPIKHEKDKLANAEDGLVSVTNLRFSGVGYSDLARVKEKLGM